MPFIYDESDFHRDHGPSGLPVKCGRVGNHDLTIYGDGACIATDPMGVKTYHAPPGDAEALAEMKMRRERAFMALVERDTEQLRKVYAGESMTYPDWRKEYGTFPPGPSGSQAPEEYWLGVMKSLHQASRKRLEALEAERQQLPRVVAARKSEEAHQQAVREEAHRREAARNYVGSFSLHD